MLLVEFFSSLQVVPGSIADSPLLAPRPPSTGLRAKSSPIIRGLSCKSLVLFVSFSLQHSKRDWTGRHSSRSDLQNHFLVRGFGPDGHARHTIHAHSLQKSKDFANGGKKFGVGQGSNTLDLEAKCEVLVCVFSTHSSRILTNVFLVECPAHRRVLDVL